VPNKKSAAKRVRQNKKRAARNRAAKSTLRTFVRKVRRAIEEENPDAARTALPQEEGGKTRITSREEGKFPRSSASRKSTILKNRSIIFVNYLYVAT